MFSADLIILGTYQSSGSSSFSDILVSSEISALDISTLLLNDLGSGRRESHIKTNLEHIASLHSEQDFRTLQ